MSKEQLKNEFIDLCNYPDTESAKRQRGIEFEKIILRYFDKEKLLISGSHHTSDNKSEQIDGAIRVNDRIFLLEVKWVESGLAASDLYAFLGKIDNKLYGTLGLFISREELSKNMIDAVAKGRQRKIILLHGRDVDNLFELQDNQFKVFMNQAINSYSFDNIGYYSIEMYLKSHAAQSKVQESVVNISSSIKGYLKEIIGKSKLDDVDVFTLTEPLSIEQRRLVFKYYMENIQSYYESYDLLLAENYAFKNIILSIKGLSLFNDSIAVENYYNSLVKIHQYSLVLPFLWSGFKSKLIENENYHQGVSEALFIIFDVILGDYNKENVLTDCISDFWSCISNEAKQKILFIYFDIFQSGRSDKYQQKKFANRIVFNKGDEVTILAFERWVDLKINEDVELMKHEKEVNYDMVVRMSDYFCRRYSVYKSLYDFDESDFKDYFKPKYIDTVKQLLSLVF